MLDELNQNESNVNVLGDFWHFGVGTDLSVKWGNLYTGFVCSQTSTDIEESPDFLPEDVKFKAHKKFMERPEGMLIPEKAGISQPLFRSKIYNTALEIPGVSAVTNLELNGVIFSKYAEEPGWGHYFNFEAGKLTVL